MDLFNNTPLEIKIYPNNYQPDMGNGSPLLVIQPQEKVSAENLNGSSVFAAANIGYPSNTILEVKIGELSSEDVTFSCDKSEDPLKMSLKSITPHIMEPNIPFEKLTASLSFYLPESYSKDHITLCLCDKDGALIDLEYTLWDENKMEYFAVKAVPDSLSGYFLYLFLDKKNNNKAIGSFIIKTDPSKDVGMTFFTTIDKTEQSEPIRAIIKSEQYNSSQKSWQSVNDSPFNETSTPKTNVDSDLNKRFTLKAMLSTVIGYENRYFSGKRTVLHAKESANLRDFQSIRVMDIAVEDDHYANQVTFKNVLPMKVYVYKVNQSDGRELLVNIMEPHTHFVQKGFSRDLYSIRASTAGLWVKDVSLGTGSFDIVVKHDDLRANSQEYAPAQTVTIAPHVPFLLYHTNEVGGESYRQLRSHHADQPVSLNTLEGSLYTGRCLKNNEIILFYYLVTPPEFDNIIIYSYLTVERPNKVLYPGEVCFYSKPNYDPSGSIFIINSQIPVDTFDGTFDFTATKSIRMNFNTDLTIIRSGGNPPPIEHSIPELSPEQKLKSGDVLNPIKTTNTQQVGIRVLNSLSQDYHPTGTNEPEEVSVHRTTLVFNDLRDTKRQTTIAHNKVTLAAPVDQTVHIDGKKYTIHPPGDYRNPVLDIPITHRMVISQDANKLVRVHELYVHTEVMSPNEYLCVHTDADMHKKVRDLKPGAMSAKLSNKNCAPEVCDAAQKALQQLSKATIHSYNQTEIGIHSTVHIDSSQMDHKGWSIGHGANAQVVFYGGVGSFDWNANKHKIHHFEGPSQSFGSWFEEHIEKPVEHLAVQTVDAVNGAMDDVKKTVIATVHWVEETVSKVITFVVDTAEKVAGLFKMIFDKIKMAIEDFFKFLQSIFEWDEILRTKDMIMGKVTGTMDQLLPDFNIHDNKVSNSIQSAVKKVNGFIDTTNKDVDHFIQSAFSTVTGENNAPSSNATDHGFQEKLEWVLSKIIGGFSVNDLSPLTGGLSPGLSSNSQQSVINLGKHMKDFVIEDTIKTVVESISNPAKTIDNLFRFFKEVDDELFKEIKSLVNSGVDCFDSYDVKASDVVNAPLEIPVISWLYEKFSGNKLKALDLGCLVFAIPVTFMQKLSGVKAESFASLSQSQGFINGWGGFCNACADFLNAAYIPMMTNLVAKGANPLPTKVALAISAMKITDTSIKMWVIGGSPSPNDGIKEGLTLVHKLRLGFSALSFVVASGRNAIAGKSLPKVMVYQNALADFLQGIMSFAHGVAIIKSTDYDSPDNNCGLVVATEGASQMMIIGGFIRVPQVVEACAAMGAGLSLLSGGLNLYYTGKYS